MKTAPAITKTKMGQDSVQRIADLMRARGFCVKTELPYTSPFDLLCNRKRVEVKTAIYRPMGLSSGWGVNLHKHGVIDESQTDVYVFELCADFLPIPIILVQLAPLGVKGIRWTPYGLLRGKYAEHVDNWKLLEPRMPNQPLSELQTVCFGSL